ncbi:MAG: hypothetical protein JXB45_11240 [Candidatus Krumholzibacteriota bacterium]|nr:hypothetical protein [Candidatus Krumholzibacteriota bacterium]
MRLYLKLIGVLLAVWLLAGAGCGEKGGTNSAEGTMKIIFLHHSTGKVIWDGGVKKWFKRYNRENGTGHKIEERAFPAESPYGWNNYPFDYWNIWVKNAGGEKYKNEPTLEILTAKYDVVIFKHCFPVSDIEEDSGHPDIGSDRKSIENYILQYEALKAKMREFPGTKFLVWTGAAQVKGATGEDRARRTEKFFSWVKNEWDESGDNIFVWDFYSLEAEGGIYLRDEYARGPTNSHPGEEFARRAAPLFCERIVEILEE